MKDQEEKGDKREFVQTDVVKLIPNAAAARLVRRRHRSELELLPLSIRFNSASL
jgi:hypothetical protein